ncbi:putative iron reductase [Moniliophthora roreri MCA 2997]|uniref:ferric-chelate reductase (NADPH) n=1 Tax=Moniliophthora roreri (strain MCA 2997) TaxID=1381753 RepID=V2XQT9_MONRO|nr:putative iron reductase [Moniliophthora roreri MCA 2997]
MSPAGDYPMAAGQLNGTAAGTGSKSPSATGGGGGGTQVDSELLMFHIDIMLLSLVAFLVLLRLPRALARFWNISEWTKGHFLWYKRFPTSPSRVLWRNNNGQLYTGGDHTTESSHTLHGQQLQRISDKGTPLPVSYPPHFVSTPALFRPTLKLFHKRVTPGMSFSHLFLMSVYLAVLVFPAFWKTNAFTDPVRFGWLAVGQYPFVFAFATKNNILGALMGAGYEKLNFMHRFAGRLALLSVNVHGLGYLYQFLINKVFQESMARPSNYWGLIALICMDCLFFFSTDFWRKRAYNLFITTHILSIGLLLPATVMHKHSTILWVYATIGIYGLDILLRTVKTRIATANVRALPELGVTRVEVPGINVGWRAGQHVRVRVFSTGMGLFGWSEIHPFTIASTVHEPEGLVLMCKKTGSWTKKLFNIAQMHENLYEDGNRKVKVMIEGPYGGPGHRMFASFSAAVFVVGGSGITFALSSIQELIQQDLDGQSRVKYIHLIWTVQDPCALVPLLPQFQSMVQQSVFTPIRISVFYTRAQIGAFPFKDDLFARSKRITLSPGRPKLDECFDTTIDTVVGLRIGYKNERARSGLIVGKIDDRKRDEVGGIEIHEETFGW